MLENARLQQRHRYDAPVLSGPKLAAPGNGGTAHGSTAPSPASEKV
jgi:hypothetical protein